jgi:hypothetical protein
MTNRYSLKRYVPFGTLLAVILGTSPLYSQGPEKGGEKSPVDIVGLLQDLTRQVKELRDTVADLRKQLDLVPSVQSVDSQIRREMAAPAAELADLRRQVDQLQRDIAGLKGLQPRVANYPSGNGRIQLVNSFPAPMTVIVNDKSYRLAASGQSGDRRLLENLPAGPFTYQVLGVQMDLVSRILTPTETFTITVYPR